MGRERWRPIAGTDGWYEVSTLGQVRSWVPDRNGAGRPDEPRLITPGANPRGYLEIKFSKRIGGGRRSLHRIVLETFVGPALPGFEACHLNHDKSDNRLSNLRWGTHVENMRQNRFASLQAKKLTSSDAIEIAGLLRAGETYTAIADRFGIAKGNVWSIATGRSWSAHTGIPYRSSRKAAA